LSVEPSAVTEGRALLLRRWWVSQQPRVLQLAVALMIVAALYRLVNEYSRLVWEPGPSGAVDLRFYHDWVHRWFAGEPIYTRGPGAAEYPPASYVILWPLLGWLDLTQARWFWAVTSAVALTWLVALIVRESGADRPTERVFVALLPLSMYAASAAIGNGQVIVYLLPALVGGLILLRSVRGGWREDLAAAAALLVTLVKPSIAVPFFWIVLFRQRRLRPILLIGAGYVALTLFATAFQNANPVALLLDSVINGAAQATRGGYANLHSWLAALGLQDWSLFGSALAIGGAGLWSYRYRHADLWLLMGVMALVARFWTYHRLYDDLLVLLPMIALFRITKGSPIADGSDVMAGILLAAAWVAALAPARLLTYPPPWSLLFEAGQTVVWAALLIFLVDRCRRP